ncbi:hypothetical protein [Spartinivicinus ruber]|uniref:hypothetical protein n=1 Tax=Spartinivicinus ruber TaxID=2683272 RepID=UPI0013D32DB2|nr:hypothetical protein [Spartinivicinus ruber]
MLVQLAKRLLYLIVLAIGFFVLLSTAANANKINSDSSTVEEASLHYLHDQESHLSSEHNVSIDDCHCCFGNCSSLIALPNYSLFKTPAVFYPAITLTNLKLFIDLHFRPPIA